MSERRAVCVGGPFDGQQITLRFTPGISLRRMTFASDRNNVVYAPTGEHDDAGREIIVYEPPTPTDGPPGDG